jgi:cation diffusion facilitator family transporter
MVSNYTETMRPRVAEGTRNAVLAVTVSTLLALIKIGSGVIGHSYALVADGIESCLDILSALIVFGGLKIAAHPPDQDHPYGHGKAESLAGLAVGVLLFGAGSLIAVQSIRAIVTPDRAPAPFTLFVLVGVVITKELLFRRLDRVGKATESTAVQADAWHHRSDALTSLAAFCGITVALVMGPGFEAADDWAALLACAIIFFNGGRLVSISVQEMMDVSAPPGLHQFLRDTALEVPGVRGVETCLARKSGPGWFVDIHILMNGDLTVSEGHDIAHEVKDALLQSDRGILNALVHIEPLEAHPELVGMKPG